MKKFNSYMEVLQDAYNELMSAPDPLHYETKEREWDECVFSLTIDIMGDVIKWYHIKDFSDFDNIEITPEVVAELKANFKKKEA